MSTRIHEWHIISDRHGFIIVNEYGEEAERSRFFLRLVDAEARLAEIIKEELDNYDGPPDGGAWSGGFAENH